MESYKLATQSVGTLNGIGTIGQGGNPADTIANVISTAIGLLTVVAIVFFMFNIITGSISIITSGGDKGAYEEARRKITNGLIGLVVTISAIFVIGIIGILLGIPNILSFTTLIDGL